MNGGEAEQQLLVYFTAFLGVGGNKVFVHVLSNPICLRIWIRSLGE